MHFRLEMLLHLNVSYMCKQFVIFLRYSEFILYSLWMQTIVESCKSFVNFFSYMWLRLFLDDLFLWFVCDIFLTPIIVSTINLVWNCSFFLLNMCGSVLKGLFARQTNIGYCWETNSEIRHNVILVEKHKCTI